MSISHSSRPGLMLLPIILLFMISGCKKDDKSSEQQGLVRLRSSYHYFNDQLDRKIVDSNIYEGNRLTRVVTFEKYGTMTFDPSSEYRITYNGDEIVQQFNWVHPDTVTPSYKNIFTMNNNLVSLKVYLPLSGSEASQRDLYENSQGLLVRQTHSDSINGFLWESEYKNEFYYMNATADSIVQFTPTGPGTWGRTGKLVFEYLNGDITNLVHYSWSSADGKYTKDYTKPYTYNGRYIVTIGSGNSEKTYQYDEAGNLIQFYDNSNLYFSTTTYQYESGSGNYQFLQNIMNPGLKMEQDPMVVHIP